MLTNKQENFCQNIVKGMNGTESYLSAYDCNNKNVANVESTKLLKRDDITQRIQELYKPISNHNQNMVISARQKQIDFINERIEICKAKEDEQSIIRYTDMLNKINALYKETEQETKTENSVNTLDTNTLLKLSGVS